MRRVISTLLICVGVTFVLPRTSSAAPVLDVLVSTPDGLESLTENPDTVWGPSGPGEPRLVLWVYTDDVNYPGTWSGEVRLNGELRDTAAGDIFPSLDEVLYGGLILNFYGCCYSPQSGSVLVNMTGFAPFSADFQVMQPIPEPSTLLLLGTGFVAALRRRPR